MDTQRQKITELVERRASALLGGEGLFNTVVTGPGRITLQTMPLSSFVGTVAAAIPSKG